MFKLYSSAGVGGDGGVRAGDLAGVQAGAQGCQVHRARDQLYGRPGGEEWSSGRLFCVNG